MPFGTGSSVPWLDQIVDSVGGLLYGAAMGIGAIGGVMAAHFKAKADKKTFDIQTSAAEIDAITKRFEALIDGYEFLSRPGFPRYMHRVVGRGQILICS